MGKSVLILVCALGLAVPAWADPEPVFQANLIQVSPDGRPVKNNPEVRLVANADRDTGALVSFDLTEIKPAPCPKGAYCILGFIPVTTHFEVLGSEEDRCGSRRYKGFAKGAVLTVVDHGERTCGEPRKYAWQVTLKELRARGPRYFVGKPEPVQPVAAVCDPAPHICPMYYMPVDCTVSTLDGGKSPIAPIRVRGGNACDARGQIEDSLCAAGLDSSRLQDSDVICANAPESL